MDSHFNKHLIQAGPVFDGSNAITSTPCTVSDGNKYPFDCKPISISQIYFNS